MDPADEVAQCVELVKRVGTDFISVRDYVIDAVTRESLSDDKDALDVWATSDSADILFKRQERAYYEKLQLSFPNDSITYTRVPLSTDTASQAAARTSTDVPAEGTWPLSDWPLLLLRLCRRKLV